MFPMAQEERDKIELKYESGAGKGTKPGEAFVVKKKKKKKKTRDSNLITRAHTRVDGRIKSTKRLSFGLNKCPPHKILIKKLIQ
jgi:hypothetical protein